jgi:hypothetical protein
MSSGGLMCKLTWTVIPQSVHDHVRTSCKASDARPQLAT